ncbi:MAG: ABC transporter ATP-binding protein [Candidatus Galacturonibacter soehngenii]|nr:ABC transporter ATP-binding protein [Candidatus Galacturonibacter soehngenii]
MSLLEVCGIKKNYGTGKAQTQALININLKINKGEFVAIMGASGSGKSTLLNLISTIDKPTEGKIYIDGADITKLSNTKANEFRRDNLGFIFQDFKLLDSLTVEENISVPLIIQKKNRDVHMRKISEIMNLLGITELRDKYPFQISGGEKQRTACARAVITNPKLILADEPTGALDSNNAKNIMKVLVDINSKFNSTILLVTHDAMSASYSQRIVFFKDGSVVNELNRKNEIPIEFYNKVSLINSEVQQTCN